MTLQPKTKASFEKTFKRVLRTPPSFAFFTAIHDFIECIEQSPVLSKNLSRKTAMNSDLKLLAKFAHLKKIHQGIKDASGESEEDLGHERYMTINDLERIRNNEQSDSNTFWKKRETFRKLTVEIYERLNIINLASSGK